MRRELGLKGEKMACEALCGLGYKVLARNYRCALGEIDLVARDGDTLVFVEIRTRRGGSLGEAKESVGPRKRRKLTQLAQAYMKQHGYLGVKARFDVVVVSLQPEGPSMEIIRNAFDAVA